MAAFRHPKVTRLHPHVLHPATIISRERSSLRRFSNYIGLKITKIVGTMSVALIFTGLALVSLSAALKSHDKIIIVSWIAQTFLQLVLLPIIMVGQNVIQDQNDAKATVDHHTLSYLAQLQDEQMAELKNQTTILQKLDAKDNYER